MNCIFTWVAPLFEPDWRPITPSRPCRICSSVKFLSFFVAILGPRDGPVYSGWFWVALPAINKWLRHFFLNSFLMILPREKMQSDTCGMFLASKRSGVWKTSSSGTPYFLAAFKKDCTFSINKNAGPYKKIELSFLRKLSQMVMTKLDWKGLDEENVLKSI